jgi:hypothetical protein
MYELHGIGFVAALLAYGLSLLSRPGTLRSWRYWSPLAGCAALLAACNLAATTRQEPAPLPPLSVALLQGNIPQDEKFQGGTGIPVSIWTPLDADVDCSGGGSCASISTCQLGEFLNGNDEGYSAKDVLDYLLRDCAAAPNPA